MDPVFLCLFDYDSEPCQGFYPVGIRSDLESAKTLMAGEKRGDRQTIREWAPDAPEAVKTLTRRYDAATSKWSEWA